jgi:glycosyltransferase involved in cell wall biosynthesis
MRVLHVTPSLDTRYGGPVAALVGLAVAQARAGLGVNVIATFREGADLAPAERLREGGVEVKLLGPARGPLLQHPDLPATVRASVAEAGVVHVHGLWEEIQHQAARAATRHRKSYVVTPHGMLSPWSLAQSKWKKRVYLLWRLGRNLREAGALHCTSDAEAAHVRRFVSGSRVIVEPLGLNLADFEPLPAQGTFRAAHPQIGDRPLVVYLGRIHPGKGVEYLIPALARCGDPRAMLAVVGPDSEGFEAEVRRLAEAQGVRERVIFTGLLRGADRVAALADADLFAMPSDHENFGISVIEALAAGAPVLISDQVNIHRELAEAGVAGVVRNDVASVTEGLRRWLGDERMRREAAAKARPYAARQFDWGKIAERWTSHYERLAAAAAAAQHSA